MRALLLILLLSAAASAGLWLLLSGGEPADVPGEGPERRGRGPAEPVPPGTASPRPPDAPLRPEGPALPRGQADRWMEARLPIPEGHGPVTGADLLEAVRTAGVLEVRAGADADLEALRREVFEGIPRDGELHHAVIEPLLRDAGYDVHVRYPLLLVRRRPPEPPPR